MKTLQRFLRNVMLLAALSACGAGDEPVIYVVITGEPPVTGVVASPPVQNIQQSVLMTPLPTVTPEFAPEVALQLANERFRDGYLEQAVALYQGIVDRPSGVDPAVLAEAAFNLGQAAVREGLFTEAVSALTRVIVTFPNEMRGQQAYFLRGDAYLGLSRWQEAINDYQMYLALRPGLADSYAHERIGDAYLGMEQYEAAFAAYEQAAQSNRSLVPGLALREKLARLYTLRGQTGAAVAQYDAILSVAQNTAYRASIDLAAAQALIAGGDTNGAIQRMRRIFETYPSQPAAIEAMNVLLEYGVPLDKYVEGQVRYLAGDYAGAVEAFNVYTTQTLLADIPAELYLLLGRAYRAIGNAAAGQVAFQTVINQYPNDPLFGEALLEQGRTRFLAGEIDAAIAAYLQIANTYPTFTETAAQALWRAGYLHGTNGRPVESREIFLQLADRYPTTEDARSGLSLAASTALGAGDVVSAELLYSRLALITTGEEQAQAYLQLGRLALGRGEPRLAEDAFNQARAAAPGSYVGIRADDLLANRAPFTSPAQVVFAFDDLAEVTEAENWLRTRFGAVREGPLWPLTPELENEPRLIRGRELWTMGIYDAAETEFFDLLSVYRQDGIASYQLAIFLRIIGAYSPSVQGAANVIIAAGVNTLDAPRYLARMRYPAFYSGEVTRVAAQYGFDPLLMLSLIRHESLFDTYATAPAGEKGLTQVIPGTAEYIAGQLNWPDYQHSDLFRPYAGIEFGAYYLAEQLNRFDDNVYAALAGYNAGPGRAIDWLNLSGGDPDAFMSAITISSTQLYIQRIYTHYHHYRVLYGVG